MKLFLVTNKKRVAFTDTIYNCVVCVKDEYTARRIHPYLYTNSTHDNFKLYSDEVLSNFIVDSKDWDFPDNLECVELGDCVGEYNRVVVSIEAERMHESENGLRERCEV